MKHVVHTEGARGIRHVLQKEGTKRLAQDLSVNLDVEGLSFCETRRYGLPAHISSVAVDPVQGLLACGTFKGAIAVTGAPDVAGYLELNEAVSVKMMVFQPGVPVLIAVDAKNAITVFDLIKRQHIFVRNARNIVTCIELLSGSNWLFHGLKDGTIDVFDVYKGRAVSYRIPNILPEGKKHSLVVSIKTHPTDNNQLLIAYNTGVVLWNIKQKAVMHTYIYEIPPGAMGGIAPGSGMHGMNESRYPYATVIAWRPDGHGFVSGYDDGCIVFWDIKQERPILARTIYEVQVNIPGIRPVYERDVSQSMPIYQLSWCLQENREDSALIVAGGASQPGVYGLNVFDFPNKPDYGCPRRHHTVTTESDILDFIVIPRDSPWFNGALDPVSIVVLTDLGGVKAFSFDATHTPQTIPSTLLFADPSLVLAKTYGQLPQEIYDRLVYGLNSSQNFAHPYRIPLRGVRLAQCDESRLCRDILVTAHSDLSVRFWEGASHRPLHHLTVELKQLFSKNHGEIAFLEFSVFSQVLAVGFSNGNWVYCKLSWNGNLSRQSSAAGIIREDPVNEALSTNFQKAMHLNNHDGLVGTGDPYSTPGQPTQQHSPAPHQPMNESRETLPTHPPHNGQDHHNAAPMPHQDQYNVSPMPQLGQDHHDAQSVLPQEIPAVSVQPPDSPTVDNPQYPPESFNHDPSYPERVPSPSLPPRPEFVEVSLPNGSEFLSAFKSSTHMGRINQVAVSGCGLVAVSDELYSLSITDTVTGRVLHVEDLKVVMLDRDKGSMLHPNDGHSDARSIQSDARSTYSDARSNNSDSRSAFSDARSTFSDARSTNLDAAEVSSHVRVEPQPLQRVGVVITSLQFVVSTTSEQDKVPSLLLVAGSSDGIYMIFSISGDDSQPMQPQMRQVKKVETFQTRESCLSVHTSIVNVMSPSENTATAAMRSTTSISSESSAVTCNTDPTSLSQRSGGPDSFNYRVSSPPLSPKRHSEDGLGYAPSNRSSNSDASSTVGGSTHKSSIYSSLKEAQGRLMSKAQQRLQYFVCVSEYTLRVHMNCTSRRIHKIDLTHAGENEQGVGGLSSRTGRIMAANVVYHGEAACILCLTESGRIMLFSIPKLELIPLPIPNGELYLPILLEPERLRESTIHSDGRIFVPILKYEFRMYSLWGHDRWVHTPQGLVQERSAESSNYVQLYDHGVQIPPRPPTQVTPGAVAGWFGLGGMSETPSQRDLDEVLGGANYRPENPILKRAGFEEHPRGPHGHTHGDGTTVSSGITSVIGDTLQGLDERGKKLHDLSNKTEDMNAASNSFLAAAKALNENSAQKKWYEF
ncbi:hypothetical protein BGX26_007730 [Mortierella sp. AD094]|nr:hypothetical protein BGX26_007730 [Mortierella sp. AD094]